MPNLNAISEEELGEPPKTNNSPNKVAPEDKLEYKDDLQQGNSQVSTSKNSQVSTSSS